MPNSGLARACKYPAFQRREGRSLQWESHAIVTDDPKAPFLARITMGTRKRQSTVHEWPALSLAAAQQQADDWLAEYCARLGIADDRSREPAVMKARWARLEKAAWLPDLPELSEKYCRALEATEEHESGPLPRVSSVTRGREHRRYASDSKIRSVVSSARAAGIDVAGIRAWPDGSVAAFDKRLALATWPEKGPEPSVNTEDGIDFT